MKNSVFHLVILILPILVTTCESSFDNNTKGKKIIDIQAIVK